jgi:hypothetical protein
MLLNGPGRCGAAVRAAKRRAVVKYLLAEADVRGVPSFTVNAEWCVKELDAFLDSLTKLSLIGTARRGGVEVDVGAIEDALVASFSVAEAIVRRVAPDLAEEVWLRRDNTGAIYHSDYLRDTVINTRTQLARQAEIEENLATPAPKLAADTLHPWVWDAARSLWETGHYRAAVQAAGISVNAHLQQHTGRRDVFDTDLIVQCFSDKDPEPGKPRLRWPGSPTDAEYRAMQNGLRALGQGAFMTIRGRATHDLDELPEHEALERLATLSVLCRLIDRCSLLEAE